MISIASLLRNPKARHSVARISVPLVGAGLVHQQNRLYSLSPTRAEPKKDAEEPSKPGFFDITKSWDEATKNGAAHLRKVMIAQEDDAEAKEPGESQKKESDFFSQIKDKISDTLDFPDKNPDIEEEEQETSIKDMGKTLFSLLTGRGDSSTVDEIVAKARMMGEQGDVSDNASLKDILGMIHQAVETLNKTTTSFLDGGSLPAMHPSNLYYFLEHEDERKNPSWRRRKHRYYTGMNVDTVDKLNTLLNLADLSYTDTMDEIQQRLETEFGYELAYCAMESSTGKPSHFVAVKKNQSKWSNILEVTLVVRGTKTITDVVTDLLCDAVDYRGGKAHAGILQSGQYLAAKHQNLFKKLCELSGKKELKVTLIGHSLGAGAASIAGMELHDQHNIEVEVIGFGCPSLVSEDLSKQAETYITTVVSDNDCVPRMSAATMLNAVLDVGEFDWVPSARRDIEEVVEQVQDFLPSLFTDANKVKLMTVIDDLLLRTVVIPDQTEKRMDPVLFPPGKCIHFYRDGYGISGSVVPCTFFGEIDISRRMVEDHLYHSGYQLIFLDLMRQHHNDHNFRFKNFKI
jgi:hypothetical protein